MAVGFWSKQITHFENYLSRVSEQSEEIAGSIHVSTDMLWDNYLSRFNYNEHMNGLLFGHVQSGKTGHMLGAAAKAADNGFKIILLLSTDNISLQKQTLERALSVLDTFNICGETDDMRFRAGRLRKPVLLILKKNYRVLETWRTHIASADFARIEPMLILDDEGDAASLNTLINENDESRIFSLLNEVRLLAPSSIFLSVTATPQSLVLQARDSAMRPAFAHHFDPGEGYMGGEFFYGEDSHCIRVINENERTALLSSGRGAVPEGLRRAILSFLVAGIHRNQEGAGNTNMLIHPSLRIRDHAFVEAKVNRYLENILQDIENESQLLEDTVHESWDDIRITEPNLIPFEDFWEEFKRSVGTINVVVINSNSPVTSDYNEGLNIVIGGNTLGRGLTLPGLHIVYYSRIARTPQADTCWQHSRVFGYDRQAGLCRVFLPPSLLHLFRELNEANESMVRVLREEGFDHISILSPQGTRPTRRNVVDSARQELIIGGVNYFPFGPYSKNLAKLNDILGRENRERIIDLEEAINALELVGVRTGDSFNLPAFANAIRALAGSDYAGRCRLIVRTERNIQKGSGTLLSPDDRALSNSYPRELVLIFYRLTGDRAKGWDGRPLWVPNVKFPIGRNYYSEN